jgi:hypothetical protein
MKIQRLKIKNFRSFTDFSLDLAGNSRFVVAECAVGKTSLLIAINRALGKDRAFTDADFGDLDETIEIELVVNDLDASQRAAFCDRIDFSSNSLTVGVRVTWDDAEENAVVEHGYPTKGWNKSTAEERDALVAQWLPAERDVGKYLQFGARRNLMARLVEQIGIDTPVQETSDRIKDLADALGAIKQIGDLLAASRAEVAKMVPEVSDDLLALSSTQISDAEILRLLGLLVAYHSEPVPVAEQSSGLGQLVLFAFVIQLARTQPGTILLIDQPELSLHPQPQRALARVLRSLPCQWLIATHSSNLLDRVDPRAIIRLKRDAGGVAWAQPTGLNDADAKRFARYTTPQTAEAFFARSVILVEGLSDLYAIVAAAEKLGRDLDSEGVSLVDMEGAGGIKTFISLLGPFGFGLNVAGMCDADKESDWASVLHETKITAAASRDEMNTKGFFVCSRDLEDELVRAYGAANVVALIDAEGEASAFKQFQLQPLEKGKALDEQVRGFIQKRGRKVRYAPLIVERLNESQIPSPLTQVLSHV